MSLDGRLPDYEWVENSRRGTSGYAGQNYYSYKPVILLHMTVGMSLSRSYVAGHSVPPHLWANPYTGDKWQTQELDLAAKALYQPQYGYHWTNKHDFTLQTELVGVPEVNRRTYTEEQGRWIAQEVIVPQVRWLRERGLPINLDQVRYHTNSSGSASEYWHGRQSELESADFNGVKAHIDEWGNDHWDCSVEDILQWVQWAKEILGEAPVIAKEKMAYTAERIDVVALGVDGNLYHRFFDIKTPKWVPSDTTYTPMGAPPGGAKDVEVSWSGNWLTFYAISRADNMIYWNQHHPVNGWGGWKVLPDIQADKLAVAVRFVDA